MKFLVEAIACLGLLVAPVLSAPNVLAKAVIRYQGATQPNSFIVRLQDGTSKEAHLSWLSQHLDSDSEITHPEWTDQFINGFAGTFSTRTVNALLANPDVLSVEENSIASVNSLVTQTNAPWGLNRISQNAKLSYQNDAALNFTYSYDSSAGAGVDIYVIDTGIYTAHSQFGGRARWGATFGGYANVDANGHGTHVSGTAAGSTFGVAKAANLIAVRVIADSGLGSVADILSGMNYALNSSIASGHPSIATISITAIGQPSLDDAVAALTNAGVHVTAAAGNSATEAVVFSPGRAPSANTIGATNIADEMSLFSNYGASIDLWAPGEDIISAWIGNTTATNTLTGTSMSTPHVAGLIAILISRDGNIPPADMSAKLQSMSVKNAIASLPSGSVNDLARNDE